MRSLNKQICFPKNAQVSNNSQNCTWFPDDSLKQIKKKKVKGFYLGEVKRLFISAEYTKKD